jgi:hypothetical protein
MVTGLLGWLRIFVAKTALLLFLFFFFAITNSGQKTWRPSAACGCGGVTVQTRFARAKSRSNRFGWLGVDGNVQDVRVEKCLL